jgi:hypothetical protein
MRLLGVTLVVMALGLGGLPARADYPDWQEVADVKVIEVLTYDADGDLRESKVWFVLLGGEPYLRTSRSRWLENLRRDSNLKLRIQDREYEVRAEEITGDGIVARVDQATREKYGWQERLIHVFRFRKPDILKLSPRSE